MIGLDGGPCRVIATGDVLSQYQNQVLQAKGVEYKNIYCHLKRCCANVFKNLGVFGCDSVGLPKSNSVVPLQLH